MQLHTFISYVLLIIVNAWVDVLSNCKQHAIRMACMIYSLLSIIHSDWKGKMSPCIMVQYVNEGVDMSLLPHGNAKSTDEYIRTKASTLKKVKDSANSSTPSNVYNAVFDTSGGIQDAASMGSLPRNKQQVNNAKYQGKSMEEQNVKDTLYTTMQKCKLEEWTANPFVRIVEAAPQFMCVLASNRQLKDLEHFCTTKDEFSILGIDSTFNLGDFSVTITTYQHLHFRDRKTGKSPIMLGPMLVHQRKDTQSYFFLASSLVRLNPNTKHLKAIGTDGEKEIVEGFPVQFPNVKYLFCFRHISKILKESFKI